MELAPYIDHTLLKPTATLGEIQSLCAEAAEHRFAAVCVPPYFVRDAAEVLQGTGVPVATVIGFPFGYSSTAAKACEVAGAVEEGAGEVDVVMNIAAFRSNDLAYLENEAAELLQRAGSAGVKLIIESGILSDEEIIRCCALFGSFPFRFLKTSTGYAEGGATVAAVRLMRKHLPPGMGIKASGGVRTAEAAQALIEAGATRLGTSSGVALVRGAAGAAGY